MSTDGVNSLLKNLLDQQERLLQQLADLEEVKDDLEESEYEESKTGTLEQIVDITQSLCKLESGNLTLTDELGTQRLVSCIYTNHGEIFLQKPKSCLIYNNFFVPVNSNSDKKCISHA